MICKKFVKFPNKYPYDTIEKMKQTTDKNPLKLEHDLRVRARDVRRHPPQSIVDEAMLHCIKNNASGEYVTIGCEAKDLSSEHLDNTHSKHIFKSICSETCRDANTLDDVDTTGNISSVYKKDSTTVGQSMLTHVLNECKPSSGYRKAKQSCAVEMDLQENVAEDGTTTRIVPNACPCASSTLNAAEVQTFLDLHKPREFKLESRCFPKETPAESKDVINSCPGIYDIPCRTRTRKTANGEEFCELKTTTKHKCKWYDRSEYIAKNPDRQDSSTMTGCYDEDDCLHLDIASCTNSANMSKCKWKSEWHQCVPKTSCATKKPLTIDEYNQLIQKNEYQNIQQRMQQTQRIESENAREKQLLEKIKTNRLESNEILEFVNKL
jgi:hypothetical protein